MNDRPVFQPDLTYIGPPEFRSLWLEIPPVCHLQCPYCFANAQSNSVNVDEALGITQYAERVLRPFAAAGGRWLGIPGAGEPFHAKNITTTRSIVEAATSLGIVEITIFTSGDLVDSTLAMYLHSQPHLRLMVKWNSSDAAIQDRLVGDANGGYTARRQKAWETLLEVFADDRSRLGLVTSIMASNYAEVPALLRMARQQGVVFDCDTLLPKGRGIRCSETPTGAMVRHAVAAMQDLDREFGYPWRPAGAYVAAACTRFLHHLYVDYTGRVFPCVGCFSVELGNVRNSDLISIWKSPDRRAIAHRRVLGACAACGRMLSGECTSCVGRHRSTESTPEQLRSGWLMTAPCEFFAPSLSMALQAATLMLRGALSNAKIVDQYLQSGLQSIWNPFFLPGERPTSGSRSPGSPPSISAWTRRL